MIEIATLNHFSDQEHTPYLFQVANKFQQSARVVPWCLDALAWLARSVQDVPFLLVTSTNVCTRHLHSIP
jgi:hypothetical protein